MNEATLSNRIKTDYPFAQYADERFPLLQRAVRETGPLATYTVEWIGDWSLRGDNEDGLWRNYGQIVRTPFTPRDDTDRDLWLALDRHLQTVENTLWDGVPSYTTNCGNGHPLGTCGGVRHYLGREPVETDEIILRIMQDCVLLAYRSESKTRPVHEFLSEFSLQVSPARAIRPHKPRVVLPAPQGASLRDLRYA